MIWTDFGGVLTPPVGETVTQFCHKHDLQPLQLQGAMERVAERLGAQDMLAPIDTPMLSESEWLRLLEGELGVRLPLDSLGPDWFENRPLNLPWVEALLGLREQGHRIGLISNMVPTWEEHWRGMVGTSLKFDHEVLSHEIGTRKPEPAIFTHAAMLSELPACRNVLIDDLLVNHQAALAAGWASVHFKSAVQAADELHRLINTNP